MKKRLKLRSWVKWLIAILILFNLLVIIKIMDREFIKKCTANGYSETYCIAHK